MKEEIQSMIDEWTYLFTKVNKKPAPHVSWQYGWFSIHNNGYVSKWRKDKFMKTIKILRGRLEKEKAPE